MDQRWADLVPSLFPRALVCRDSTVNVAYWNLRERRLEERDGQFTVDGEPLADLPLQRLRSGTP